MDFAKNMSTWEQKTKNKKQPLEQRILGFTEQSTISIYNQGKKRNILNVNMLDTKITCFF